MKKNISIATLMLTSLFIFSFLFTFSTHTFAAELVWKVSGLDAPESSLYDSKRNLIYVSNLNGQGTEKNALGYISLLSTDGNLLQKKWMEGLHAPKGLALVDNMLYVADIDQLVVINVDKGKVAARHSATGAKFLNDVVAANNGQVYVSDMFTDAIYTLTGNNLEIFVQDSELLGPNGLLIENENLIIATWGKIKQGFETESPGYLKMLNLVSKKISTLGDASPVGHLDGIEPDGTGNYLVTDWMAGSLYRIKPSGQADLLLDLNQGSADLGVIAGKKLVIVPMMLDGEVNAYRLDR